MLCTGGGTIKLQPVHAPDKSLCILVSEQLNCGVHTMRMAAMRAPVQISLQLVCVTAQGGCACSQFLLCGVRPEGSRESLSVQTCHHSTTLP